jgi:polysaccharide biosynthesis transport protein
VTGKPIDTAAVSKVRLLAIALILGLLLSVGVAFLQEIMADVFHSSDELKRASKLPVLGVIPRLQDTATPGLSWYQRLPFHKPWSRWWSPAALDLSSSVGQSSAGQSPALDNPTLFTEAFYSFCTNLQSLITAAPTKSLVISSPGPQDGKSTIAIHLAQAAAASGHKVLLVDANLRSPQIHEYLQIANTRGFSDLSDVQLDFQSLLHHPRPDSGLFILTAGQYIQDPVQRLSSPHIQASMQKFAETFDLVIYDTPSFLQFADANLMAARADGLILVACLGRTTCSTFRRALENMQVSSVPILGIVVNQTQEI